MCDQDSDGLLVVTFTSDNNIDSVQQTLLSASHSLL
jgi:hypothetical protein